MKHDENQKIPSENIRRKRIEKAERISDSSSARHSHIRIHNDIYNYTVSPISNASIMSTSPSHTKQAKQPSNSIWKTPPMAEACTL